MNGSYSKFIGTHTFKMGADYRKIGVDLLNPGSSTGTFQFDKEFTSSTGLNNNSTTEGNAIASLLLGYPTADSARQSTMTLTTPLNIYTNYFGGYWQDDWRVNGKFTLNYGLRVEHEDGMREQNNNFTVGFDTTATSALSTIAVPADPVAGTPARTVTGGLMYTGVNGNKTEQGNAPKAKWSPRVGAVYSIDSKTVLRGGYGLYLGAVELSGAEQRDQQLRADRLHQQHRQPADRRHADDLTEQPVSERPRRGHRQRRRPAERRRHDDQLCRSESHRAARAAVLR